MSTGVYAFTMWTDRIVLPAVKSVIYIPARTGRCFIGAFRLASRALLLGRVLPNLFRYRFRCSISDGERIEVGGSTNEEFDHFKLALFSGSMGN